jgi:monoamine oxidase
LFNAHRAIFTLPLGVLLAMGSSPAFEPAITEKRRLWQRLKMGNVVKAIFRFERPIWPEEMSFLHTPDDIFETWWTMPSQAAHVLTGWVGGPKALRLSGRPPGQILATALPTLARALQVSPEACAVKDWRLFDWPADSRTRGAYMYVPVGEYLTPFYLAEPVENTLYFAGEATNPKLAGTIAGAVVSGANAAKRVLDLNNPREEHRAG